MSEEIEKRDGKLQVKDITEIIARYQEELSKATMYPIDTLGSTIGLLQFTMETNRLKSCVDTIYFSNFVKVLQETMDKICPDTMQLTEEDIERINTYEEVFRDCQKELRERSRPYSPVRQLGEKVALPFATRVKGEGKRPYSAPPHARITPGEPQALDSDRGTAAAVET